MSPLNAQFTLAATAAHPTLALGMTAGGILVPMAANTSGYESVALAANSSTTAWTPAQAYKTVASTTVPEALVALATLVESVTITAQKNRTTANTGNVWVGFAAGNDTQLRLLTPGDSVTYTAPDGKKIDLSGIYVDVATNGDGVLYESGN